MYKVLLIIMNKFKDILWGILFICEEMKINEDVLVVYVIISNI